MTDVRALPAWLRIGDVSAAEAVGADAAGATGAGDGRSRQAAVTLAVYAAVLAGIAFWPVPVDRGASGFLRMISQAVPWLTYDVIEFSSNVVLFVPFGVLVAVAWPWLQGAVVMLALAATLVIESGQGLFLGARTASLRDVVANVLGAAIGVGVVVAMPWVRKYWAAFMRSSHAGASGAMRAT